MGLNKSFRCTAPESRTGICRQVKRAGRALDADADADAEADAEADGDAVRKMVR